MPPPGPLVLAQRSRWLAPLIICLLVACGSGTAVSSGSIVEPLANSPVSTASASGTTVPAAAPITIPPGSPVASAVPNSADPPGASAVPVGTFPPSSRGPAPSSASGNVPAAPRVAPSIGPSVTPSTAPSAAPPVAPTARPSATPRVSSPSPSPSPAPQASSQIAAQDGRCPESYPWSAYIGPGGERWYRSPTSVAIYYRQPPTLCFESEAAAKLAGYAPDPRPARYTKSVDGTCPKDNPVKGFTSAQSKQVYLLPNDPGYAAQQATDCFSDDGVAQYFGFEHAGGAAPGAEPSPAIGPSPGASPAPSGGPQPGASPAASASPQPSGQPADEGGITLSPATLDFGTVALGGASSPGKIVLTNAGQRPFEVRTLDIRVTGQHANEFGVKFEGCDGPIVGPGKTCTISITFRPAGSPGARTAEVRVSTGAGLSTTTALKGLAR